MRRREFVIGASAAATPVLWPLAAHARQPSMPLIGFLDSSSPEAYEQVVSQFKRGLGDAGYIEGQNVGIEFRWRKISFRSCRSWPPISSTFEPP
jgi:putative tryptophan/tyrosine transport system substrate-binding protein